jgi:hypothetical protein
VTCFFLYLIPRGLRIVLPLIQSLSLGRRVRVVTYMSPFPSTDEAPLQPVKIAKVASDHHPESQWPLFYYEFPCDLEGGNSKG